MTNQSLYQKHMQHYLDSLKTSDGLKRERERIERLRARYCPNHRIIEPKHQRLEKAMLERSKPVNRPREQEFLAILWSQVAGK